MGFPSKFRWLRTHGLACVPRQAQAREQEVKQWSKVLADHFMDVYTEESFCKGNTPPNGFCGVVRPQEWFSLHIMARHTKRVLVGLKRSTLSANFRQYYYSYSRDEKTEDLVTVLKSHTARKWQSQDLDPDGPTSKSRTTDSQTLTSESLAGNH